MLENNKFTTTVGLIFNFHRVFWIMNRSLSWVMAVLSVVILTQNSFAAPPTLEIFTGSGTGAQGPINASGSQTFLLNRNNPSDNTTEAYTPTTSVSYNIINSVYNTAIYSGQGNTANKPELMFGGTTSGNTVVAANILQRLNAIGSVESTMFAASLQNATANCSSGTDGAACLSTNGGIDAAVNQGVNFLALAKSLVNVSGASTSRVKIGTVQISFNRPVTNPILQASGLGGTAGTGLGLSAEFTLTASNTNVTMQRIAGNRNFAVNGMNIVNTASTINASSASGGASGTVYLKGKGITSLTFDIYMRGDGGSNANYTTTSGDAFFFGISSIDADSDLSIVKSQRVGSTGNFVTTQLNDVPLNSVLQYQLLITNNKPLNATVGGSVYLAPFADTLPSSLKDVTLVGTATTTGTGTTCSPTISGNVLQGTFTGAADATCVITIQATAATADNITNTASVESSSTDLVTSNDSSSVTAAVLYPTITGDATVLEARFNITPNVPVIERGRIGTQLIDIKNEGPNAATNTIATYIAAPATGVTVASVGVVGGAACTQSGSNWTCPLGSLANGATKQLSVSYSTASTSTLGLAQQASIRVSSDEFNPGSGVGETLYKVWGTNQQNEISKNGAFWVGYEGTGGTASVGSYTDEGSTVTNAWPITQASPTGGYLVTSGNAVNDSVYAASSTTAPAMIQRVITNMSSDANASVQLNYINAQSNGDIIGDNRRAWEYITGVYVGSAQTAKVCMGSAQTRLDDSGYILVDGVEVGRIDSYYNNSGNTLLATLTLQPGYHRITYRIANRNTYNNNNERSAGGYGAIGLSLSGDCSTAKYDEATVVGIPVNIQIIDGAKIKIAKTSINGVGTFSYTNLNNLVNNSTDVTTETVTTVTAGTTVISAQQLWAKALSKDVTITETMLDGYVLSGVSCTDANSATSGNTGTFWTLTNQVLTIPVERIKEGANITCTFTNTKLIYIDITGRVFADNSGTTLDASKAYNAVQDTGEVGIANSTIVLNNCSTTQLASTVTRANGDYVFSIEQNQLPASFCIVQQNLPDYTSVSGTTGYTRSTDTITLTKTSATSYSANNFGDVNLSVVLNEDGQHTAVAGDVTDYPHRLITQTPVQLTQMMQTQTQQPSGSSDQPWQALVYRDSNCNGQVDAGEGVFNPTATNSISLLPNTALCLVQRVFVPKNVAAGAKHIGELQASYQFALSNPSQTISGQTLKRQDVTLIGSAGLTLTKKVRAVASCPSTSSDTNVFAISNQAAKKDNLEYEITYKNNSSKKLQNVKVKDTLPTGTTFGSMSCSITPSGNTCATSRTDGALTWNLTGLLSPAASGTLRFCVAQ